jgi:acyl-CoA synthetase (AMP-forming)/AMP-acid ligase II
MRSMDSLDFVSGAAAAAQTLVPSDRVLAAIPLCHSYGMEACLLSPVFAGCEVRLLDGFDAPLAIEELCAGATVFPGVPAMFDALSLLATPRSELGSLRMAFSAGGPLPHATEARFRARTGLGIGQLYGATELGWVTFAKPDDTRASPGTVGSPLPGVSVLILDPASPDPSRPLPIGADGQVAVSSPSMLSGYLGAETPMAGGHFLTGDLGRLDPAGGLKLTGRLTLFVDVGGLKVNPYEVEQVLLQHPGVGECVVVPLRMSDTVHRLRAVVTPVLGLAPGLLTVDALRRHAQDHLAPHKVPRLFDIRASLPRSASGKVLRRELELA